jgi:hypothetical protein
MNHYTVIASVNNVIAQVNSRGGCPPLEFVPSIASGRAALGFAFGAVVARRATLLLWKPCRDGCRGDAGHGEQREQFFLYCHNSSPPFG